jgi:chromosome partitioning protein
MFPAGLTMIDSKEFGSMGLGHVAARQELREMMAALQLPDIAAEQPPVPGVAA